MPKIKAVKPDSREPMLHALEKPLYDFRESAEYLGMSLASFYRLARPQLHGVRLGPNTVRFRRADLDAFITSRVEAPGVEHNVPIIEKDIPLPQFDAEEANDGN